MPLTLSEELFVPGFELFEEMLDLTQDTNRRNLLARSAYIAVLLVVLDVVHVIECV